MSVWEWGLSDSFSCLSNVLNGDTRVDHSLPRVSIWTRTLSREDDPRFVVQSLVPSLRSQVSAPIPDTSLLRSRVRLSV